jgi:cation transport ATPase
MSIMVGVGRGALAGVLIKNAEAFRLRPRRSSVSYFAQSPDGP